MSYKPTSSGAGYRKRIDKTGKEKSLRNPAYRPPLERVVDPLTVLALLAIVPAYFFLNIWYALGAFLSAVILFSLRELFIQDDHALIRIYGPLGRIRYMVEDLFRDKYLQYFNETNTDGRPIPKIVRDYIYQKAHNVKSFASFGTELDIMDVENTGGSRILHRNFPGAVPPAGYQAVVGAKREGVKPFIIKNCINVSAMSYGSINERAAECLSFGARDIAYVNSGEGGYGPHGVAGNDVVFQMGTGKFGVGEFKTMPDGTETRVLNDELMRNLVREHANIKMIQLKISQGAKPGLGGHLPGSKVTEKIAAVRKVPAGKTVISPARHAEIMAATPKEMILKLFDFIDHVRKLTELPVGIKLCVGHLSEIDMLVDAMKQTGKGPDAIQVDGADGGTGAGPNIWVNYVGYGGTVETTAYLDARLKEAGIRDTVSISSSGRILTPAHGALAFAAGADFIDTARGAMLSLGCIQALACHTNHCPTGITTNSSWRKHGLDIPEKSTRVHHYLNGFHSDMLKLTTVMGYSDPRDITPHSLRFLEYNEQFGKYFEDDPFGVKTAKYQGDTVDAIQN